MARSAFNRARCGGRTGRRGNIVARGDLPMGWSLITSLKANKCWYELCCLWLA